MDTAETHLHPGEVLYCSSLQVKVLASHLITFLFHFVTMNLHKHILRVLQSSDRMNSHLKCVLVCVVQSL